MITDLAIEPYKNMTHDMHLHFQHSQICIEVKYHMRIDQGINWLLPLIC